MVISMNRDIWPSQAHKSVWGNDGDGGNYQRRLNDQSKTSRHQETESGGL